MRPIHVPGYRRRPGVPTALRLNRQSGAESASYWGSKVGVMVAQLQRLVDLGGPYDLPRSLSVLQRGHGDPAVRIDPGHYSGGPGGTPGAGAWKCRRLYSSAGDELGQATFRFDQISSSAVRVRVAVSSEEVAELALNTAQAALGSEDDWVEFDRLLDTSGHEAAATLAHVRRRHPGVRLPATLALFDQLVNAALEQKVTHDQARHAWRQLLRRHGRRPPSAALPGGRDIAAPDWMRLPLSASQLQAVPSWDWHRMWVQPQLSRTVLQAARRASSVHRLAHTTPPRTAALGHLAERLTAIPGIGIWTAAEALQRSHGAADLPSVGDFHLAHFVGEALTGRRTDDSGMLELLEPYRPHRQQVIRLLGLTGFRHQRFGPRLAPADHRNR